MSSNIKIQRICQHCSKEFTAHTTVTRYCGNICAKNAYKDRKRKEKISGASLQALNLVTQSIQDLQSKDFLTITETCRLLSVSRWTLWRAIKNETIKAARIGRKTLIRRTDLDNLFELPSQNLPVVGVSKTKSSKTIKADHVTFNITESYTLTEVQEKYSISESALQGMIKRNNIPKIKKGWFAYVPKKVIDELLK